MQSIYLTILALIIVLVIVPIPFGGKLTYSPYKNFGVLVFKILGKKVRVATFSLDGLGVIITTKKGVEYQEFDISVSKHQIIYVQNLLKQLADKIKIKNMYYISRIGTGDAMKTSLTIGLLNQLFCGIFGFLKNNKQTASIVVRSFPEWDKKVFCVACGFNVSISVYDLLFCLIYANLKSRRKTK